MSMEERLIIEPANNGFIASNDRGVKLIGKTVEELAKLIADQTTAAVKRLQFGNGSVALTISVETILTPKAENKDE